MEKALVQVMYGVHQTRFGWCEDDDRTARVDGRSLLALLRRGLISASYRCGFYGVLAWAVELTDGGRDVLKELGGNP